MRKLRLRVAITLEGFIADSSRGGDLACQLLAHKLVDEISLALIPILLGDGIPRFRKGFSGMDLKLLECKAYETGVVCVTYAT